jgi:DNA polymerase-3 subunit alpha
VKGVGDAAIASIVAARADKPFVSIWDFCERVDKMQANKRVLEALIKAGAFDSTGDSRKGMLEVLPQAMALGAKSQADAAAGQFDLFGDMGAGGNEGAEGDASTKSYPAVSTKEFTTIERLDLEKEATGLYMSGHPLDDYVDSIALRTEQALDRLEGLPDKSDVRIGGMVTGYRSLVTKKGDPMAFCSLEDQVGNQVRIVVLPKVFESAREKLQRDRAVVVVKGRLDANDGRNDVVAEEVIDITDAPSLTSLIVRTEASRLADEQVLLQLQRIMANYSGDATVDFRVQTASGERVLRLGSDWKVSIDHGLKHELRELLGPNSVA